MLLVDLFTKMSNLSGRHENATGKHVADTYLEEVWKLPRKLTEIISDMEAKFSRF